MGTIGNNINNDRANARDAFFTKSEKEFFAEFLERNPQATSLFETLKNMDSKTLYNKAMELHERAEAGEFDEEEMKEVEAKVAMLFAAIEDIQKTKDLELDL